MKTRGVDRKVAIVTGAAGMRGIGRAVALRFAQDGLDVALVDIKRDPSRIPDSEAAVCWQGIESVAEEIGKLGRRAICIEADISDPKEVDRICAKTATELGPIDVLVNNARAPIGRDRAPIVEMPIDAWDQVMLVNIRGMFLMSRAVAAQMLSAGTPGCIINMSSLSGKRGLAKHAAYTTSKFAMNGFTQCLALELGASGINVNAICPGFVDSGRYSLPERVEAQERGVSPEQVAAETLEKKAKTLALQRIADPDDIAGMAAFLISKDARHITGQAMNVCGGEVFH
jgi:NAD(P)-dependent dehydrogenase (short-subunit alcohol dehydrogenase family)